MGSFYTSECVHLLLNQPGTAQVSTARMVQSILGDFGTIYFALEEFRFKNFRFYFFTNILKLRKISTLRSIYSVTRFFDALWYDILPHEEFRAKFEKSSKCFFKTHQSCVGVPEEPYGLSY